MSVYDQIRMALLQQRITDILDPDPVMGMLREHSKRFEPEHTVLYDNGRIVCDACGELSSA